MVCPGIDLSWTPLFLVVGVGQVILRLKTGRKIRLNGSTGEITLLD